MNETTDKTASSLAISEKRAHRPGGCVGIFFQLFDWNRRFAKKKLFSRKLLPPVRAKASKKFGGDEKMPKSKLHLIADENSGGFPNVKKKSKHTGGDMEQKHEMRAPGLVARLMGLESMPAVHRDKPKKPIFSGRSCDVRDEKSVNGRSGNNAEDLILEKGSAKMEPRPQKIQKVGQFDRRAVTRFGAEALQIRSVLSRSRKHHHHPKLAAPVKSPRISSVRNAARTSRLIDAATKILEPGLQATNRAKSALTYSSSMHSSKNEVMTDEREVAFLDVLEQSDCNASIDNSLMGQTSCKNCGNLLDAVDSKPNLKEQPFVYPSFASELVDASSAEQQKSKPRPPPHSIDTDRDSVFQRIQDRPLSGAVRGQVSAQSSGESNADRKPQFQEGQAQWHLTGQPSRPQKDEQSPIACKQRTQAQIQASLGRDGTPPRAKLSNLQSRRASSAANAVSRSKDFVALNRSLSSRPRPRMPSKVDDLPLETEKRLCNRGDVSSSQLRTPVRKKRTIGVNGQADDSVLDNSAFVKQRNVSCDAITGNGTGATSRSMDRICLRKGSTSKGTGNRAYGNKETDVVSFTFNSPLRQKACISKELNDKGKRQNDIVCRRISHQRKLISEDNDRKTPSQRRKTLTGDAVSALLEQKLKELASQEEDELATACTPKRSTAMILQELITALTAEQPISQDVQMFSSETGFQAKGKTKGISVGSACYGDHLSPGSVLEASFSNESCVSSSLDDSSGHMVHLDSMEYSYDHPQPREPDIDLLDSATSLNKERRSNRVVTDLVSQISRMLWSISHAGLGLSGDKLIHLREVILTAELLFGNATLGDSHGMEDLLLGLLLHDEVETLASAMRIDSLFGFEETKENNNQFRRFLFDCALECLDSKYIRYCNLGFNAWRRLPLFLNSETLIREVGGEIRKWTQMAGMVPDELVEWEMSHSLGKWVDFEIEAFETGTEIHWDILQILVEEIVVDLWECSRLVVAL